ncbi:MAG: AAA family ATPase [Leptothrix sp. (in: b-proteobacteria)]
MKINHIKISNILGIDSLEFDAGQFNTIAGTNGAGKTSVLEAIKAALRSGHDATLLRAGAEKGEVVLVLDNGGTITKRVGADTSTSKVAGPDGKASAKPAAALQQLTDLLSVNPVDFLLAPARDRARYLLEAMPLEADAEHLQKITGVQVAQSPGVHALAIIDAVRKQVYDDRTGTNRAVREKDATINQLRAAMPPAPGGIDGDEDALLQQLADLDTARDTTLAKIDRQLTKMRADHEAKLDALRQQIDAERAAFADVLARANGAADKARTERAERAGPIGSALQSIRTHREAFTRRTATLATIELMQSELATLQADAEKQTAALAAVDQYKADLLGQLPIPGIEVRDGEVFRDGVAFDRLNTAAQVQIAVDLAKLRAGRLGVACVDRLESLDTATFEAFKAAALQADLQLFVTRVTDGEFGIQTDD